MTAHEVTVMDGAPTPSGSPRFQSVCSCGRWRGALYATRGDALDNALAHTQFGDEQNRAAAALSRGPSSLVSQLAWYERQASDHINPEADRDLWSRLADEVRERLRPTSVNDGQDSLF